MSARRSFLVPKTIVVSIGLCFALNLQAVQVTFTSADRTASLGDALAVTTGVGNAGAATLNSSGDLWLSSRTPWTKRAERTSVGTSAPLTIAITTIGGAFVQSGPLSGTWAIDASFWTTYADAAISMHVGNGNGDPDHWIWHIEPGKTSGTWSYEDFDGKGGGLSNFKLYSSGIAAATATPEGGSTLMLVGLAMAGLGLFRRR